MSYPIRSLLFVLACSVGLAQQGHPAMAQPAGQNQLDFAAGKVHYQAAETAVQNRDFAKAAQEYGLAYKFTQDPVLFFKIASSYKQAGDCTSALAYYSRFLAEANPSPEHRSKAEAERDSCSGLSGTGAGSSPGAAPVAPNTPAAPAPDGTTPPVAGPTTAPSAPTAPVQTKDAASEYMQREVVPMAPKKSESNWQISAGWVSLAATFALATTGAILTLSAESREEDLDNLVTFRDMDNKSVAYEGTTKARYEDLTDEGESLSTLAKAAWIAAGVTTAAGVGFFIWGANAGSDEKESHSARIVPVVSPDSAQINASWSF